MHYKSQYTVRNLLISLIFLIGLATKLPGSFNLEEVVHAAPNNDSPGSAVITLTATGFDPPELTIEVNTEVVWRNDTDAAYTLHTGAPIKIYLPIIIRDGTSVSNLKQDNTSLSLINNSFVVGVLPPGGTLRYSFTTPGNIPYYLAEAPQLTGLIIVNSVSPISPIDEKYTELGGTNGFLGTPTTPEKTAPDGIGRYRHYQGGSIYWHPDTGAHEVHGAIRTKWKSLGWERSFLGYPTTDETTTPDGRGRFNHFQGGSIYWHPDTGAHEVHGAIRQKWASLGWERSILGYPTSDEQNASGGGRISYFEHGSIRWGRFTAPLTILQQNMALLVSPASYKGTERSKAIDTLISKLRSEQPGIVGLSEAFDNDERDKIKGELRTIYPYTFEGPDEADLESDGGLLLLSKHPIIDKHQTIYRQCKGEDCLANKGALHARIQVAGHPAPYDVFLSHLQNPNPDYPWLGDEGPGSSGRDKVKFQLTHLASFIQAYSSPQRPVLLMGDLNTNARKTDLYNDMMNRLAYPEDLWNTTGNRSRWPLGITRDKFGSFSSDEPLRLPDHPARHKEGTRLDLFLSWQGVKNWPIYSKTEVVNWQSSPGRDISDHYGLKTQQVDIHNFNVNINRPIRKVTVALTKFHCLEETDEAGSDEVYFRLYYATANGKQNDMRTSVKGDIDSGDIHTYNSPVTLAVEDTGAWLDITVRGWEEDDWPNDDDYLGSTKIRLERSELLELIGRSTTRVLPLLTGDGGEYAMTVTIRVE